MGYKTSGNRRVEASSAVSSTVLIYNNPDGTGVAISGTGLSDSTQYKKIAVIPGQTAAASTTLLGGAIITGIFITDNAYTNLDDTAISTGGGYIKLIGTGFMTGCTVYVNGIAATTTTFVSSTEIRAVVQAYTSGTYSLMMFNTTGSGAIWAAGLVFSGFPIFTTGSYSNVLAVVNTQLLATGDGTLVYSLQGGSTLPSAVTLSSSGLLSGTISGITQNTVYTFTVLVNDAQLQTTQQLITLTVIMADTNFSNTVLALHGDADTFIRDTSTNNFEIAPVGTPIANRFNPIQDGYYSNSFNGSTDYLATPSSQTQIQPSTGNFTIEFWFYITTAPGDYINVFSYGASGNVLRLFLYTPYSLILWTGSTPLITADNSFIINTWNHVAVVRNGTTVTMYVNGVSVGTPNTGNSTDYTGSLTIGFETGQPYYTGNISNFRIVKGTAVYTGAFTPPTAPLTAITNTVLLTCQSNRFRDNSTNLFAITRAGTPSVVIAQPFTLSTPYTGYGSGLLNGSTDYFITPNNANLYLSTSNFTIELWVYGTNFASGPNIIRGTAQYSIGILASSATALAYYISSSSGWDIAAGISMGNVIPNAWNHVALVRSGSTFTPYVNGVAGTPATSASAVAQTNGFYIGAEVAAGTKLAGYISNVRIVKGTAVYTGAFTPPTAPLAATQNAGTNIAAITGTGTSLLTLLTNQAYNNNQFRDSSQNNFAITRTGTPTQGTFTPFSLTGWSGYFDGVPGTNINLAANAAYNLSTGQYFIQAFCYPLTGHANISGNSGHTIISQGNNASNVLWSLAINLSDGTIYWGFTGAAVTTSVSYPVLYNTWNHIAVSRDASNVERIFLNGKLINQRSNTTNYSGVSDYATRIGSTYDSNFPAAYGVSAFGNVFYGYLSNVQVVVGNIPAYFQTSSVTLGTTIFTSPTVPATAVAGTVLLTLQNSRFKDNSTTLAPISLAATPSIQSSSPFAPSTTYGASTVGGSIYLSGSSSFLTLPQSALLRFPSSGSFTIEGWIYLNAVGTYQYIYSAGTTGGTTDLYFGVYNTNVMAFVVYSSGGVSGYLALGTTVLTKGSWNHIAVTRNVSTIKFFLNGAAETIASTSGTPTIAMPPVVGPAYVGSYFGTSAFFNGYISNLRVLNGTSLYNAAFTPSTAPLTATTTGTMLLLNGTNAGIYDQTGKNNLITVADSRVSTGRSKFGTGALYFDGTGDYLMIPSTQYAALGTTYTIECWQYRTGNASGGAYTSVMQLINTNPYGSTVTGFMLTYDGSSAFNFRDSASAVVLTYSSTNLALNTWYHVAIVRNGSGASNMTMYINGTSVATGTSSGTQAAALNMYIGGDSNGNCGFPGYIDDFRITNGVARYTGNFTPSAYAFPDQ